MRSIGEKLRVAEVGVSSSQCAQKRTKFDVTLSDPAQYG